MRMLKKILTVMILLLILEIIYIHVEGTSYPYDGGEHWTRRLSIGFPFHSVEYTIHDFKDILEPSHPAQWEWEAGLNIYSYLFIIDVLFAILIFIILTFVSEFWIYKFLKASLMGLAAALLLFTIDNTIGYNEYILKLYDFIIISIMVIVGLFLAVAIYKLSLMNKHQNFAIISLSIISITTTMYFSYFIVGLSSGGEDDINEKFLFALATIIVIGVFIGICFTLKFFHKLSLRKKRNIDSNENLAHKTNTVIIDSLEHDGWSKFVKKIIVFSAIGIILLYLGFHFYTIKKMKNDNEYIIDVILNHFEDQVIYTESINTSGFSFITISPSLKTGLNALYQSELRVNGKDMYYVELRKNIFIPWIQVEQYKLGTEKEFLERLNSND